MAASMMNADLDYVCENDDCWKKNYIQQVPTGKSADCPYCGWSMTSVIG